MKSYQKPDILKGLKLVKKAYTVDLSKIEEGYLWDNHVVFAETASKAKKDLLSEYYGATLRKTYEEISFLNIPVIRFYEADRYMFEGELKNISDMTYTLDKRKRNKELDAIMEDPNITHMYIYKRGGYYADNHCGYVSRRIDAGIYEKADAVSSARSCSELEIIPIDIEEHNNMVNEAIKKLSSRLIKVSQ